MMTMVAVLELAPTVAPDADADRGDGAGDGATQLGVAQCLLGVDEIRLVPYRSPPRQDARVAALFDGDLTGGRPDPVVRRTRLGRAALRSRGRGRSGRRRTLEGGRREDVGQIAFGRGHRLLVAPRHGLADRCEDLLERRGTGVVVGGGRPGAGSGRRGGRWSSVVVVVVVAGGRGRGVRG